MPDKVFIGAEPFEGLVRAALETAMAENEDPPVSLECAGALYGQTLKSKRGVFYAIRAVHPFQIARREHKQVECENAFSWSIIHEGSLGQFHSHPHYFLMNMSREIDVKDLKLRAKANPDEIEILLVTEKVEYIRKTKWNPLLISGQVRHEGDIYRLGVSAYNYRGRLRRIPIVIPGIIKQNIR